MGINLVLKTRIKFNGKEYGSADEMPADERQTYERAMAGMADPEHAKGMIIRTQMSSKFTLNDQEYDGVDHMPPEVRKTYETAVAAMEAARSAVLGDAPARGPGLEALPSVAPASPAASTLRSPLNRTTVGPASPGPHLSRVFLILGLLAGLIAVAVCVALFRRGG